MPREGASMQVDYARAALFLNISMHVSGALESQVTWWQHPEVRMKAGLDPRTQVGQYFLPISESCVFVISFVFSGIGPSFLPKLLPAEREDPVL
jgi:hypothetical protein